MKFLNLSFLIIAFLIVNNTFAQVSISTDGSNADGSAMLDVKSANRGFLPPRLSRIQRDAINSPAEGLIIFNKDDKTWQGFNGTAWENFDGTSCLPDACAQISGADVVVCEATAESYQIDEVLYATNYYWTVPEGSSIIEGQGTTSITVNFGFIAGNVSVRAENGCGNSEFKDFPISLAIPSTPTAIVGSADVDALASGISYHVEEVLYATSYNWILPDDAYITTGQGTSSITVDFGINTGNISVSADNTCGSSDFQEVFVMVGCGSDLTDSRDNSTYTTVRIGNQCWMAENLNYEQDAYGNDWCYQNTSSYCNTYGRLYDWQAIMQGASASDENPSGVQGLCPENWHVPSYAEWSQLISFLGGTSVAGGKMKETGTTHWDSPNTGATNSNGFTALPAGRQFYGYFNYLGLNTLLLSTSDGSFVNTIQAISLDHDDASTINSDLSTDSGGSLRCIKNY